jgi:hypothetical protein
MVALTEIAVIGLIVAILTWKPQVSLTIGILLVLVILIGLAAIVSQVNELFRLRMAKHVLPLRLEEGQALFDKTRQAGPPQVSQEDLRHWNNLTEENLRQYEDELHVARFRFVGYRDHPGDFTTYRLEAKLNFLNEHLEQLRG